MPWVRTRSGLAVGMYLVCRHQLGQHRHRRIPRKPAGGRRHLDETSVPHATTKGRRFRVTCGDVVCEVCLVCV